MDVAEFVAEFFLKSAINKQKAKIISKILEIEKHEKPLKIKRF